MSRFSKAAAEALGWSFTHESEPVELANSHSTGVVRTVPASVRAEKFLDLPGKAPHSITEEADTLGLLLERIHSFELHLESRELPENAQSANSDKARAENDRVAAEEHALQSGVDHAPEGRYNPLTGDLEPKPKPPKRRKKAAK